jgi:hypothetical protein
MVIDELVADFLHELDGWERAYPLTVFPEPDMNLAAELLVGGGLTLDAVSASNMRHVVSVIAPKARAAVEAQASLLLAMKEALEMARPHVVNASLCIVPKESEACAMDDLRMIDATLNQGVPGDVR